MRRSNLFWHTISTMRMVERAGMVVCGLSLPLTFLLKLPLPVMIRCWLVAALLITISVMLRMWLVKRPPDG